MPVILHELANGLERLILVDPMLLGRWHSQTPTSELVGVRVVYGWVHPGGHTNR